MLYTDHSCRWTLDLFDNISNQMYKIFGNEIYVMVLLVSWSNWRCQNLTPNGRK